VGAFTGVLTGGGNAMERNGQQTHTSSSSRAEMPSSSWTWAARAFGRRAMPVGSISAVPNASGGDGSGPARSQRRSPTLHSAGV